MDYIVCSDLESVYIPETWMSIAERTGIESLRLTTRDTPDYDRLMAQRIEILRRNNLRLKDVQAIVADEEPYPGAREFIDWVKERTQFIIVSDIFKELALPFMRKLDMPALFCNRLIVDDHGFISGYKLRQMGGKRMVVLAMKTINYRVAAFGDSYNDIDMIREADLGFLYNPSNRVVEDYPEFRVVRDYGKAKEILGKVI